MLSTNFEFTIEDTKDGLNIIQVNNSGRKVYIGSKYNMKNHINEFVEDILNEIEKDDVLVIYGFSTGDHIKILSEKLNKNRIIIFEPNLNMKKYISSLEWVDTLNNVEILCDKSEDIEEYMKDQITIFDFKKIKIKYFPGYERIYKNEIKYFNEKMGELLKSRVIDSNTQIYFNKIWYKALFENLPYMLEGSCIEDYSNKFKGKPAVIVSAGPSLDKNIQELKKLDNEMMIISGGRTLKPLLNIDVMPHLLTVIDAGETSYTLVENYIDKINIPLFFYEKTNDKVVSSHNGKKIFTTESSTIKDILKRDIKNSVVGGSVAHVMVMGAIELGCNPIIFIGQDLAYTNEETHANIASHDKYSGRIEARGTDSFVESIDGNLVRTSAVLNDFRLKLEDIIRDNNDIEFINATEGGARINGTVEMTLNECINKFAKEKINFDFEGKSVDINENKRNALKTLNDFKSSSEKIVLNSKKAKKLIEDLKINYIMKKNNSINLILSKLDDIDEKIKEECNKFEDIKKFLYPIMYTMLMDNKEYTREIDILNNNFNLYSKIISEFEDIKPSVERAIEKLQ